MDIHQEVVAQRDALAAWVRRLDPDLVPATQVPGRWQELDVMDRQIAAAKALLARRVEDSHRWAGEGFASPAAPRSCATSVRPPGSSSSPGVSMSSTSPP